MLELIHGDITKVEVDAIVNAANSSLLGGGGVDGAIHRAGGKQILEECIKIRNLQGGCKVGEAVITAAGNLPAKYVIHTVGPVWKNGKGNESNLLAAAYTNSLALAEKNGVQTIAFPNISTGVYHFPGEMAAEIALEAVRRFLKGSDIIQKVIFVCFESGNYDIYKRLMKQKN